jgi:hypothetical protein
MRTTSILLNSCSSLFFAFVFGCSFFARDHIESRARAFVTDKTLQYSRPVVDIAEQALAAPVAGRLLTDKQLEVARDEIKDYRADPVTFISNLTQKPDPPRVRNKNPLLEKVASVKDKIREYYNETLSQLLVDLRIFSATNCVASVLALGLAIGAQSQKQKLVVSFSILMFVMLVLTSDIYLANLTFWRILLRIHMGWQYPVILGLVSAVAWWAVNRTRIDEPVAAGTKVDSD